MRIIKAICFLLELFLLGVAYLLPFWNPLWFIYSVAVCVVYFLYGNKISAWTESFMTNNKEKKEG